MFGIKRKLTNGKKNGTTKIDIVPPFAKNLTFQRWAMVICTSLILALILSPRGYFSRPKYEEGSIATRDIKAKYDFLVKDKTATEKKRFEAAENTKPVYDYDGEIASKIEAITTKAFLKAAENLKKNRPDRNDLKDFESDMGIEVTPYAFKVLKDNGFAPHIYGNITKLIRFVYDKRFISDESLSKPGANQDITLRDIKTQKQREIDDSSSVLDLEEAKALIDENSKQIIGNGKSKLRNISLLIAKEMIRPNLTFAKNATEKARQDTFDSVKPVFFKVQKNEIIAREGEKITSADIDKINALFKGQEWAKSSNLSVLIGIFLIAMLFSITIYRVLADWIKLAKNTNIDLLFLCIAAILQIILVKAGLFVCEAIGHAFSFVSSPVCFYAIPFAMGTMLVTALLNRNAGFIFSIFSSFFITFFFAEKVPIALFSFIGSMTAAYSITYCKQRSAFFRTGLFTGLANMATIICLSLISGNLFMSDIFFKLVLGFAGGILSGLIVSGIVPQFETLFGYITDMRLLELANLNQPIFQEMIMVAPGTYHHSIIVASMVEAAAEEIGANSLLAKVSAYYHDMGKIKKPDYYIENQQHWKNRHDKLTPKMSSLVIISHVKDGCELAKKYKLGRIISDIIRQHHGTRIVTFFYEKAKNDKSMSGQSILESDFRYPGPKPQTKEAGLVLLGDIVEASSRMLKDPTPSRIKNLIRERISEILNEGQLDESELTFLDLNKISESFSMILIGIFHRRIDYPGGSQETEKDKEKGGDGDSDKKPAEKN